MRTCPECGWDFVEECNCGYTDYFAGEPIEDDYSEDSFA